ncbi:Protein phosphatase 1 regulatory subunit 14A [Channa argus]|uniref:Protein phosphatase 1 regulatory subunit 14A n=1 Tax=Channa argus TaxID=215402 RepID=A0A6G1QVQ5_CHAAH|nr:Protein phosphatase 1 regulatory subunit 14A [Channa argus]
MKNRTNQSDQSRGDMAEDRNRTMLEENDNSSDFESFQALGCTIQKRQARVTVKYNRKELQRRLDVEKWIDECLDRLYSGQEGDMPEEVNIDDLIDLPNDEERVQKLKTFIRELLGKLQGLHKQEELQSEGIEHPVISHSHYRHEPYHFNNPHQQQKHHFNHTHGQNQTL